MAATIFSRETLVRTACACCILSMPVSAATESAPAVVQAAVFIKLLAFHKGISASDSVDVYVVGSEELAAEMRKGIGRPIGNSVLKQARSGTGRPSGKPSVVYIGDAKQAEALMKYTRENDVLSITGVPELSEKGVTLTVCIVDGRLRVFYNGKAASEEGASWESGLFKVVEDKE